MSGHMQVGGMGQMSVSSIGVDPLLELKGVESKEASRAARLFIVDL